MTEVDTLLSRKYKEMLGYYNIINDNNNTILTGDTTILSSLNVKNESIFNNSVSINTNLLVYGETYLHDITINSILYSNNFFINNNLISSSDINIKNNFYAAGSLNSNIIKASNSTITSDLYVSGITTINNNLYSNRIFAFNTSLSIISNKINIGTTNSLININGTGLFIINNNTAISSKSIILNNKRTDNGGDSGIEIYGLYGNGYIKTLPTADRFIIKAPRNSDYGFITTLNSNGDLIVNGYSIFKKALTINSTLNILGNTIYQNDVQINLNLFVSNITIIKNTVTMLGNINIDKDITIWGNTTSLGNLTVNGNSILNKTFFNSNLMVLGNTEIINNITINASLNLFGDSIFLNNVFINSNVNISNNSILHGLLLGKSNISILNDSMINNSVTIFSNLTIHGNNIHNNSVSFCSNVYINGNTNLNNNTITGYNNNSLFTINGRITCPLKEYQTNSLASINNIPVWGFYRTGGIVKIRLDVVAPEIVLNNEYPINLVKGTAYNEPGLTVTDNLDNDIVIYLTSISNDTTANIITTPIDILRYPRVNQTITLLQGTYTIKYLATDSVGNTANKLRTLIVVIA